MFLADHKRQKAQRYVTLEHTPQEQKWSPISIQHTCILHHTRTVTTLDKVRQEKVDFFSETGLNEQRYIIN